MAILKDILYKVTINKVVGSTSVEIQNLAFDSRKIEEKDAFIAIRGSLYR